jgi:MFS family permease
MEAQEKNLSHTESLAIIQNMIATAKNNLTDNGFHFMLWGTLVIAASLAQYLLAEVFSCQYNYIPWYIMPVIGVPAAFIYEANKKKHEKVKTHFDSIFGYLWSAVAISIFLIIFISIKSGLSPIPFILAIVGLGTFVSGNILNFKPLVFGSIVFWIAAVACSFVDPIMQLLINGIATFIGYIIPGIILWRNYKAETHV